MIHKRTQILIADDHELTRRILANLISQRPEWELCAEAVDGQEAVEFADIHCPDVAILDMQMPRLNGLEAARLILENCPDAIVISDSLHDMNLFVEQLKEIGVKGFVDKRRLGTDLLPTVEAVLKGETRFPTLIPMTV
jgi:DNA-binding NarL/FixJ family response regulator